MRKKNEVHEGGETSEGMTCYLSALLNAVCRFYREDARQLSGVDERAMVGCIYRYMWDLLSNRGVDRRDVDIEYNRMHKVEGQYGTKAMTLSNPKCQDCPSGVNCLEILCKKAKPNQNGGLEYRFRPDVIVHDRGMGRGIGSELVVEVKKNSAHSSGKKFDKAKLLHCTCDSALKYKEGAFVLLKESSASVQIFRHGSSCESYHVDRDGQRER